MRACTYLIALLLPINATTDSILTYIINIELKEVEAFL